MGAVRVAALLLALALVAGGARGATSLNRAKNGLVVVCSSIALLFIAAALNCSDYPNCLACNDQAYREHLLGLPGYGSLAINERYCYWNYTSLCGL